MPAAAGITLALMENQSHAYYNIRRFNELIADASDNGCRHFIMELRKCHKRWWYRDAALGYDCDATVPCWLRRRGVFNRLRASRLKMPARIKDCTFRVACDERIRSVVRWALECDYGPQKGATQKCITEALLHYAELSKENLDHADRLTQVRVQPSEWICF